MYENERLSALNNKDLNNKDLINADFTLLPTTLITNALGKIHCIL